MLGGAAAESGGSSPLIVTIKRMPTRARVPSHAIEQGTDVKDRAPEHFRAQPVPDEKTNASKNV